MKLVGRRTVDTVLPGFCRSAAAVAEVAEGQPNPLALCLFRGLPALRRQRGAAPQ